MAAESRERAKEEGKGDSHIERPRTFAQILHNVAFGDVEELGTLGDAWRNLYDYVQPDLILFDHRATALLMAGKPILQLPIYLEQMLNAAATVRLGAGLSARINRPEEIAVKLMALLCSESHAEAAGRFAKRHADFAPGHQVDKALRRIEELAS